MASDSFLYNFYADDTMFYYSSQTTLSAPNLRQVFNAP